MEGKKEEKSTSTVFFMGMDLYDPVEEKLGS